MRKILIVTLLVFLAPNAFSNSPPVPKNDYPLPATGNDLIGEVYDIYVREGAHYQTISKNHNIGYFELIEANPQIKHKHWRKMGKRTQVWIPAQYILPNTPREGIVINLAELRLYYYPPGGSVVYTYSVGIGRQGWKTPLMTTRVASKAEDPTWYPPKSVRDERKENDGYDLPLAIPPGTNNPLGKYALRLAEPSYVIHGTNNEPGVGHRVSAGCIRMYNANIKELFQNSRVGTRVQVVYQVHKIGWQDGDLYLEVHEPLSDMPSESLEAILKEVGEIASKHPGVRVKRRAVADAVEEKRGIPVRIS